MSIFSSENIFILLLNVSVAGISSSCYSKVIFFVRLHCHLFKIATFSSLNSNSHSPLHFSYLILDCINK